MGDVVAVRTYVKEAWSHPIWIWRFQAQFNEQKAKVKPYFSTENLMLFLTPKQMRADPFKMHLLSVFMVLW